MATVFTSNLHVNIVTSGNTIYTVPAATTTMVLSLTVANKTANPAKANVYFTRSGNNYMLACNVSISNGSSFVPMGEPQKTVLLTGDSIVVNAEANATFDTSISVMEMS
jgi:hypothetical protein